MKRHKALQSLSHDHHHGLLLAQLIKTGSPEYKGLPNTLNGKKDYALKSFEKDLVPHFRKEEDILFPVVKNKSKNINHLVEKLIAQHKQIYLLVGKIKASDSFQNDLDELGKLLELHIRKEERELFQEIQKFLNEDELNKLENDLGSSSSACKV